MERKAKSYWIKTRVECFIVNLSIMSKLSLYCVQLDRAANVESFNFNCNYTVKETSPFVQSLSVGWVVSHAQKGDTFNLIEQKIEFKMSTRHGLL